MARSLLALVAPLVALLASLVALLLALFGDDRSFVLTFACGAAMGASLWVLMAVAGTPTRRYRDAVEVAWADGQLSGPEKEHLATLQGELGLSEGRAARIERESMGTSKEETKPPERTEKVRTYLAAVQVAWADGKLHKDEDKQLGALEVGLGISGAEAEEIERKVMGGTREEMLSDHKLLDDTPCIKLIEGCVDVIDELDRHMGSFDPKRQELADHVSLRMEEVLERSGVDVISDDKTFDSTRHKPERGTGRSSSGTPIAEVLSPGFAVGRRVLRRARVRLE